MATLPDTRANLGELNRALAPFIGMSCLKRTHDRFRRSGQVNQPFK
jgi:hypothetical protein